ncbi:MAG: helix-turn-helix transcriptional regulator [Dehalococcoidia bacterium]|nr:helix-turn-helix transcriptional regulator [Dehalococcoidia bacterium]
MAKDFLDEMVQEFTALDPEFPQLFKDAKARRAKLRELARKRTGRGLSQTQVAARMGTSQSVVARIESGDVDVKLSTLEKYAMAIGARFEWNVALASAQS